MASRYSFSAKLWRYPGSSAAWFFITLPKKESERLKKAVPVRRGWGSIRVAAKVGKTSWATSVFPDSQSGTFLLPVKASVRRAEGIDEGDKVPVKLQTV